MRLSQENITLDIKLNIILEMVDYAKSDAELAYVAAGPLEVLIQEGSSIYPRLDIEIRKNPNMRKAICGVWINENSPAGKWLREILNKYGLTYSSL